MPVKQKFLNFVMPVQIVRLQAVACLAYALIRHRLYLVCITDSLIRLYPSGGELSALRFCWCRAPCVFHLLLIDDSTACMIMW